MIIGLELQQVKQLRFEVTSPKVLETGLVQQAGIDVGKQHIMAMSS